MKNALQLDVDGYLDIQFGQSSARLEAKEGKVWITFPSFKDLLRFHRLFKKIQKQQLPAHHPLQELLNTLQVSYLVQKDVVGQTGPDIKSNWSSAFTGIKTLKIDTPLLLKAFLGNLFKRH